MADKPILFSRAMVFAILDDRKTMTRRLLNPQPPSWVHPDDTPGFSCMTPPRHIEFRGRYIDQASVDHGPASKFIPLPYIMGDRLWVREDHYRFGHWEPVVGKLTKGGRQKWKFVADSDELLFDPPKVLRKGRHHKDPATPAWHKRIGRFMPRSFSRLTPAVTGIKVERYRNISEDDAALEGFADGPMGDAIPETPIGGGLTVSSPGGWASASGHFMAYWEILHQVEDWDYDPWLVAISFTAHHCNIDEFSTVTQSVKAIAA